MSQISLSVINILLVIAFIADRIYRIKATKEYKEAKDAQIESLKLQLELERKNNDIEITEMHKKRYESLKVLLYERELQLNNNQIALLELQTSFEHVTHLSEMRKIVGDKIFKELNRTERQKKDLEVEKESLLKRLNGSL